MIFRAFLAVLVAIGVARAEAAGSLVMAGGALRPETAEVWTRLVGLAGGAGARIAVFGSASEEPEASARSAIETLERYGAVAFFVPVATELPIGDFRQAAQDPMHVAAVDGAGGVFFTGGEQARITRALIDEAGHRTPVLEAIWRVYRRGGVIAGTSAGAAIMSPTMFSEPREHLELLRTGLVAGSDIAPGLGFVGGALFVDQHAIARGRFARMLPAMAAGRVRLGLGVDENTAAVVTDGTRVEIVGRSGAVLIDLADAQVGRAQPFTITDARIGLLGPGDRLDLDTGRVTPAAAKRVLDRPSDRDAHGTTDMLGRDALIDVMTGLVDSRSTEVVGHAPGFAFRFRKGRDSRGHFAAGLPLRGFTVLDLLLDVTPTAD